ncbi:MAG: M23 family metallopeptidase [Bacteroidetes bacterium]|nr:M23 family metallopeptidase [Bacteroidota bacterium]
MHFYKILFITLIATALLTLDGCSQSNFDSDEMKKHAERLKEISSFQYPLENYFPETPVTDEDPPTTERGELHHAAEDSYASAGTPVCAIGDGIISYSGKRPGYGWLVIIDHPVENVYSLYGHLSTSRWKKGSGKVKKGELIGYLGDPGECYTMRSHIHFGLRMGQRADYPSWGWEEARWTAGYTNSRPELLGWFCPSQIIGQTDSIRTWHKYIQKREVIVNERSLHASDFKITSGRYNEKEDLDQIIRKEFCEDYRLADWNDISTLSKNIEEWADSVGFVESGEENALLISNDGYRIWLGRQYFISRFNHSKPEHFLEHNSIDSNFVCLGSWYGLNKHILAVKK